MNRTLNMADNIGGSRRGRLAMLVLAASLSMGLAACLPTERRPEPMNRVVVLLDASGSYRARQAEAAERTAILLDAMAQRTVRRWEKESDRIVLISLDAMPEIIWEGTLHELKSMDHTAWDARFRARTDYARCTDVDAAFRLAAQHLEGDSRSVHKYLIAFTDLIHEPPTESLSICQKPTKPSGPSEDFPWEAFRDVAVSVLWVPPDQKLVWRRAVETQGLTTFALYTTAESKAVTLVPPLAPKLTMTEADRKRDQASLWDGLSQGVVWIAVTGIGGICFLLACVVGVGWYIRRRRRRPQAGPRPPSVGARPLRMPSVGRTRAGVAPLRPPADGA